MAISPDEKSVLVLTAYGAQTSRLVELDLQDGALVQVVAQDPAFDLTHLEVESATGAPQWVTLERDHPGTILLDDRFADVFATLRKKLGGEPEIVSRDRSDEQWIVQLRRDSDPAEFHLHDRRTGETQLLFVDRPELAQYELAAHEPFSFSARDGLTISGYLSFPPGLERRELPMALWVHGGPQHRDVWGFNGWAQLYANRGYLAVELNYRGSTGYGVEHLEAGNREWGGAMSTDILDVIDHLVGQGWVDRRRVGITGASYGGFAALAGVAFTPDVFRCAVDIVGPSNLLTLLRSFPPYWGPYLASWYRRVGDRRPTRSSCGLALRSRARPTSALRSSSSMERTTLGSPRPSRTRSSRP